LGCAQEITLIYSDSKGSTGVQQPVDPTRTAEGGDLRAGLAVVILAWNHVADTIECMESVISAVGPQGLIIVVDNDSSDGTPERIESCYPQVVLVRSGRNLGVAGGYNLGIARAMALGAEFIAILNNDVVVDGSLFSASLAAHVLNPSAGMIVPKIYHYYGSRTRLWCAGMTWRSFRPAYSRPVDLDYATSCALVIRTESLRTAGLFDESYFFYYDDHDLCERFRRAGYLIRYAPDAVLWHKVSVTTQKSTDPGRWWYTMGQSSVRFYLRYKGVGVVAADAIWFSLREAIKFKFARILPYWAGQVHGLAAARGWV
jgi:GT2 family glycosyltransferase